MPGLLRGYGGGGGKKHQGVLHTSQQATPGASSYRHQGDMDFRAEEDLMERYRQLRQDLDAVDRDLELLRQAIERHQRTQLRTAFTDDDNSLNSETGLNPIQPQRQIRCSQDVDVNR